VGGCPVSNLALDAAFWIAVSGNYAYVCAGRFRPRLEVIDVSDPARPVLVGTCELSETPGAVTIVGNYAYVTDAEWGLQIIRLRDVLTLNPPILSGDKLALCWTGGPGIKLQKTTILSPANWQDVTGSGGVSNIELPRKGAAAFFRLIKP
jgi:hypothetical protein